MHNVNFLLLFFFSLSLSRAINVVGEDSQFISINVRYSGEYKVQTGDTNVEIAQSLSFKLRIPVSPLVQSTHFA